MRNLKLQALYKYNDKSRVNFFINAQIRSVVYSCIKGNYNNNKHCH